MHFIDRSVIGKDRPFVYYLSDGGQEGLCHSVREERQVVHAIVYPFHRRTTWDNTSIFSSQ